MNKFIIIAFFVCGFSTAHSQVNLTIQQYDSITNEKNVLVEKNKNLQDSCKKMATNFSKDFKKANDSIANLHKSYQEELKTLVADKEKLSKELYSANKKVSDLQPEKISKERESLQNLVNITKTDNSKLVNKIDSIEKEIVIVSQQCEKKVLQEKENGKHEVLANLVNTYKNKPFDYLVKCSSIESIQRDILLVGDSMKVKLVLNDLLIYLNAKEQLTKKFDAVQIKNTQMQLNKIIQKSDLVNKIKETVEKYQEFNKGLKSMLNEIKEIDNKIPEGEGVGEDTRKTKFNLIYLEISSYIFNYNLNFTDYPYLSDIVLQTIKRKQPNIDADVTDLLNKL
jgi:hypothetical protein